MAKPYQEGKGWSVRVRIQGSDIYLSGYPSAAAARKAADTERVAIEQGGQPQKLGPRRTYLAVAFQDYARERLPFLKGARQNANRINQYLRACGLPTIRLEKAKEASESGTCYWAVLFEEESARIIPNSLKAHRSKQEQRGAKADKIRRRLARKMVADISTYDVQQLVHAMNTDNYQPATVVLEFAELRRLFNYAQAVWKWAQPAKNPTGGVNLPIIDNARDRVLSNKEWRDLCKALQDYNNPYVIPAFALLLETAMRSSEPLTYATWANVDWGRCLLHLKDGKAGARDVPLTPGAIEILQKLKAHAQQVKEEAHKAKTRAEALKAPAPMVGPEERILPTSYEALKKAWAVGCEAIGLVDVNPHDLRHTAATRFSFQFHGNLPVLKLITGHKTDSQVMRYVNVRHDDVVRLMHGRPLNEDNAPAGYVLTESEISVADAETAALPENLPANVVQVDFGRRAA